MEHKMDEMKGRAKEAAGALTDDEELEREGKMDQAGGKAKKMAHDAKDKVDEGIDEIKEKLTRE